MIRRIIVLVASMCFLAYGCHVKPKHQVPVVSPGYDFEECYTKDNERMNMLYGNNNFYFYEAKAEMSLPISDANFRDSAFVRSVNVIFQLIGENTVIIFTHPLDLYRIDSVSVDVINGSVDKDLPMALDLVPYNLRTAMDIVSDMGVGSIDGTMVVLRRPDLDIRPEMAFYLFGDDTSFVAIDYEGNIVKR